MYFLCRISELQSKLKKKHLIFLMLLPENNISQADDLGLIDFEKQ